MTTLQWPGGTPPERVSFGVAPAEESRDRVTKNPEATKWRRAARAHQARWREERSWPVGSKTGLKRPNPYIGSTIDAAFARAAGANFLTAAALAATLARLDEKQAHETLDAERLFGDLLSSMPMAFNLFGPLAASPPLAVRSARALLGDTFVPDGSVVEMRFEWSPGRRGVAWTADRTAADVAILVETRAGRIEL